LTVGAVVARPGRGKLCWTFQTLGTVGAAVQTHAARLLELFEKDIEWYLKVGVRAQDSREVQWKKMMHDPAGCDVIVTTYEVTPHLRVGTFKMIRAHSTAVGRWWSQSKGVWPPRRTGA